MSFLNKVWQGFLSKHPLFIIVLIVFAFLLGFFIRGDKVDVIQHKEGILTQDHGAHGTAETIWTCAMHPQIRLPEPGKCPICGMELIPAGEGQTDEDDSRRPRASLSSAARELAKIETQPVLRRRVESEVRLIGKVAYDETRVKLIAARFPGRIEKLHVDFTGDLVRKGTPLISIYSPQLLTAQQELIEARKVLENKRNSEDSLLRGFAEEMYRASRKKLMLWGLSEKQIAEMENDAVPSEMVIIDSPIAGVAVEKAALEGKYVSVGTEIYKIADLSYVWVNLEAYEADLPFLKVGHKVMFEVPSFPGETFHGKVDFIHPVFNESTRTVVVRVSVVNENLKLKPGMLVNATGKFAVADGGKLPLTIPDSAPLITGKRAVVYVELPDKKGTYEGRQVVLGPHVDGFYVVGEGLSEGEKVVVSGAFKIDSEVQISARKSMMNPSGGVTSTGHNHGGSSDMPSANHENEMSVESGVSDEFAGDVRIILKSYLALQSALSSDDFEAAKEKAAEMHEIARKIENARMAGHVGYFWSKRGELLTRQLLSFHDAKDISQMRNSFIVISKSIIDLVENHEWKGKRTSAFLFFCPMADDGKGAFWLQKDKDLRNPYYGKAMLTCGELKKTLSAPSGK